MAQQQVYRDAVQPSAKGALPGERPKLLPNPDKNLLDRVIDIADTPSTHEPLRQRTNPGDVTTVEALEGLGVTPNRQGHVVGVEIRSAERHCRL